MQNELSAMIGVVEPARIAIEFVTLVMKMDGPARENASRKRFSTGWFISVWSRALHMTNMSSAPIPIIMKVRRLCAPAFSYPVVPAIPEPMTKLAMIVTRPPTASRIRL